MSLVFLLRTIGSLTSAFAPARLVCLAVKLAFAFTRPARFPSGLSQPLNSSVTFLEDNAPLKLPTRHCPDAFLPRRLESKTLKMGVSLSDPLRPKTKLQILPTTLRRQTLKPISSYSKAPGVFSSRCRYPASSRESHFHRAHPRDRSPVVRPFMRSGTYPERNCATLERL